MSYQLIVYCDASAKACAATAYIRIVDKQLATFMKTNLIFSKLTKKRSNVEQGQVPLPRLELLAVLIGVRTIKFVTQELPIAKRMVLSVSYTGSS